MQIFGLFSVTFIVIFSVTHTVLCDTCEPVSCGTGPIVQSPFRLDKQPTQCGYQGFELSCNNRSQVVLNLPYVGDIVVNNIDYSSQTIYLKPNFCSGYRARFFETLGTPFSYGSSVEYTFFNCSPPPFIPIFEPFERVDCFSSVNNTVVAVPTSSLTGFSVQDFPESCSQTLNFPILVEFVWDSPSCRRSEKAGCSVSSNSG